ncbi:MAG: hypothetical protein HQL12_04530 [Candidatus Omnitrophica bacterium]|nr:hypothetical protein [Candidatus Omnitrophota bacterium]
MKKTFCILGVGLLVLIIVVIVGTGMYIGPIVKIGMQELGPQIIQVPVKVDAVDVGLFNGAAQIKGLIVGNPEGYKTPQAISVGLAAVSVDPFSVLSDKIVVRSVQVKSPQITFEGGLSSNNLSQIMDNVNAFSKKVLPAQPGSKPAPKIEVDDFLITGAKVYINLRGFASKEMTLPLPDIHLTDLGRGANGLTPAELIQTVLKSISGETIKAVGSAVTGMAQDMQHTGTTVFKSVNGITGSISGLFKK